MTRLIFFSIFCFVQAIICIKVFYLGTLAVLSNPVDPAITKQRKLMISNQLDQFNHENGGVGGTKLNLFCSICKKYVHDSTKHCSGCNRCCYGFDHHCDWLNNCIGKQNYSIFRRLIAWYLIYLLMTLLLIVLLFVKGKMVVKTGF